MLSKEVFEISFGYLDLSWEEKFYVFDGHDPMFFERYWKIQFDGITKDLDNFKWTQINGLDLQIPSSGETRIFMKKNQITDVKVLDLAG